MKSHVNTSRTLGKVHSDHKTFTSKYKHNSFTNTSGDCQTFLMLSYCSQWCRCSEHRLNCHFFTLQNSTWQTSTPRAEIPINKCNLKRHEERLHIVLSIRFSHVITTTVTVIALTSSL